MKIRVRTQLFSALIISNHEDYLKYLFVEYHHSSIKTIYQWQLQFRLKFGKLRNLQHVIKTF